MGFGTVLRIGDKKRRCEKVGIEDCELKGIDMTPKDYEIAKKLKEELSKVIQIVDFKVFGSRAKGKADEYSDLDVFIEVEQVDKALEEKIDEIAWEIGFENSILIAPLIFTRNEIEHSPLRAAPIVKNINEEGVSV